jgi:DNA-directed RNA polymerase I, II, and III subunit RPABC1
MLRDRGYNLLGYKKKYNTEKIILKTKKLKEKEFVNIDSLNITSIDEEGYVFDEKLKICAKEQKKISTFKKEMQDMNNVFLTFNEFKTNYNDEDGNLDYEKLTLIKSKENEEKIIVFWLIFPDTQTIGINMIMSCKSKMENLDIEKGIIITSTAISNQAQNAIDGKTLEIFEVNRLIINITKHDLVDKHELVSREEKAGIRDPYGQALAKFPIMPVTDRIARYYGWKKRDLVKITMIQEGKKMVIYKIVK